MKSFTENCAQFFEEYGNKFLDQDNEVDIHEIFYVLQIFKAFLESVTISKENYHKYFSKKMIAVWLEQLRVQNKTMKELAKSITINFNDD